MAVLGVFREVLEMEKTVKKESRLKCGGGPHGSQRTAEPTARDFSKK